MPDDGAGQIITAGATDVHGMPASASIEVNVDHTPPTITLAAPTEGTTTRASSVEVRAIVSDALSGVTRATCNEEPAVLFDGTVSCSVRLYPGVNSVIVGAMDAAGNSASAVVRVTRETPDGALTVFPALMTVPAGSDSFLFYQAAWECGPIRDGVTWSSSDSEVLSISNDGVVTGHMPGTVTITAELGNQSATATATVITPGHALPRLPGTTMWTVTGIPGRTPRLPKQTRRVDDNGRPVRVGGTRRSTRVSCNGSAI